MTSDIKSPAPYMIAWLALFCCFGAGGLSVCAQVAVLSTDPPIIKTYDTDNDESSVIGFLDPSGAAFVGLIDSRPGPPIHFDPNKPRPDMRLHSVKYTYPGTIPTRPQAITFVIVPLNHYKTPPNFSVIADGSILLEGEATLRERRTKIDRYTENTQHIVVTVSEEVLQRIIQAKKIELKLTSKRGKYSFKLNDRQKKCVTGFANIIG